MFNNRQIFAVIREPMIDLLSYRLLMPDKLIFAVVLGFATAVHAGEDCTVYEDKNFGGRTVGLTVGPCTACEHRQPSFFRSRSSRLHTRWL